MTALPVATPNQARAALTGLLRPYCGLVALSVTALTGRAAAGLAGPAVIGVVVDRVLSGAPVSVLTVPALVLAVAVVTEAVLATGGAVLVARLAETVLARLREDVVARTLHLPLQRVEQAGSGDLLSRVGDDVAVVSQSARDSLPVLLASALTVGLTLVGLAVLDWRLALAGLLAAPIQLSTLRWYLRRSGPLYIEERQRAAERTHRLVASVDGAATVRAWSMAAADAAALRARAEATMAVALTTAALRLRFFARLNGAEFTGLTAILVAGSFLVEHDSVSVGAVTTAGLYFVRLFDPFNALLFLIDEAQRAGAAMARLVGVVDLPPAPDRVVTPREPAGIEVREVGFGYLDGPAVLDGVSLRVAAGERVALVGVSGAGKTTLAGLIAGVRTPRSGSVQVGGVAPDRGGSVALVSQEVHVFAGPLADDLRLARPDANDASLWAALELVGAAAWTRRLPQGLMTMVGTAGLALTPTQTQQVALARLALADPAVAILDEASAEAGSAGAAVLEAAADRVLAGRTAIVVAHRLTQAAAANRIVVMRAGRIVEEGRHEDLVGSGGEYATLWAAWSGGRD